MFRLRSLVLLLIAAVPVYAADPTDTQPAPKPAPKSSPKTAPKKKTPPKPTVAQLQKLLDEQRALIDEQQRLIVEQQARIAEQETTLAAQGGAIEAQQKQLADLQEQLLAMTRRLEEIQEQIPGLQEQQALAERLKKVEEAAEKIPELPPDVVSAGDFPGSIRIPGTDAAIKFGGRIRTAAVFTLDPLGSSDRFVTYTIPVEPDDAFAGIGKRTTFSANTSRLNFELRTPTGVGQMRAFIEGDFFGTNAAESRTNFRLRHAYAQFHGFIMGQTWSTFSDPATNVEDLDFEGINGENVIRQPQIRYVWVRENRFSAAVAAETPEVSLTGGAGENLVPDLVGRTTWTIKKTGHVQTAIVLRQIRGTSDLAPTDTKIVFAWGASVSGSVPFHVLGQDDRFVFQLNFGRGNARYINDLNTLGGQDGAFDPATGELHAIRASGGYLDYEHQWKHWQTTRDMRLRSSVIWSRVDVGNLDFQPPSAYHQTNRYSVNVVFSPIPRIDVGVEFVHGNRENKDGHWGSASQIQTVGVFRF